MLCPLLIPLLILIDDKTDTKPVTINQDDVSYKNAAGILHVVKQIYYFYTAPMVKFCCHSVTTGNLSVEM